MTAEKLLSKAEHSKDFWLEKYYQAEPKSEWAKMCLKEHREMQIVIAYIETMIQYEKETEC